MSASYVYVYGLTLRRHSWNEHRSKDSDITFGDDLKGFSRARNCLIMEKIGKYP